MIGRLIARVAVFALGGAVRAETAPPPRVVLPDAAKLRIEAEAAEKAAKWDLALELYLRAYVAGRPTADLRERIRVCLRNVNQIRRHRDPAFQQFVLSLSPSDALNLYAEVVGKLKDLHLDRDRATPARLFALGLDELHRALADDAFRERHLDTPAAARVQKFQRELRATWLQRKPTNPREARGAARELVQDAQTQLGVRMPSALVFELICGACTGLDEYTVYIAPSGPHAELAAAISEFAEYGLLVRFDGSDLVIDGVVAGSWAAFHSALRKGDRIERVNGRTLEAGNPVALAQALRAAGPMGHELELLDLDSTIVVRLPVPMPTVYGHATDIVNPKDGIGYVRISSFRETTPRELDEAIFSLKARGVRAVIIDLRNNAGGLFTAAIHVAQRFLPNGIIVTTQGTAPEFAGRVFSSDSGMMADDIPIVLLIDTKTMSAAEAVAAAWKDHNRATLVGLPTFGKGVIQAPIRLTSVDDADGAVRSGVLVLTVASMFAPRGGPINGTGVTPHIPELDAAKQLDVAIAKALELASRSP